MGIPQMPPSPFRKLDMGRARSKLCITYLFLPSNMASEELDAKRNGTVSVVDNEYMTKIVTSKQTTASTLKNFVLRFGSGYDSEPVRIEVVSLSSNLRRKSPTINSTSYAIH
jgi:hypothetical protein